LDFARSRLHVEAGRFANGTVCPRLRARGPSNVWTSSAEGWLLLLDEAHAAARLEQAPFDLVDRLDALSSCLFRDVAGRLQFASACWTISSAIAMLDVAPGDGAFRMRRLGRSG
jgi:hypothetical protein